MSSSTDVELLTVLVGGSSFGLALFLISRPGRQLLRHLLRGCSFVVEAPLAIISPSPPRLPDPFGPGGTPSPTSKSVHARSGASPVGGVPQTPQVSSQSSPSISRSSSAPAAALSPFRAFVEFLYIGDFEITRDVGSDAAAYLRFQRMVIKLLVMMSVVGAGE
jgi:hypothetical protein